jgi:hypothetical protein
MRDQPRYVPLRGWGRRFFLSVIILPILTLALTAQAQAPHPGLANDFEVDGNLIANNPGGPLGAGSDWLDGPGGPGTGVLFPNGTPKDPLVTWHFLDLIMTADEDVFAGSAKVDGNPNSYEWKAASSPAKDDIQNGLIHLARDGSGNHWMILGGDRRAINGDSYIDFEFLQNPLVMNAGGSFTSQGPHGGRTIGDLLLTIELVQGGSQAEFFAQQWASDGHGGYDYVDIPFPAGAAFVAANIDSLVKTGFNVFGADQYDINQFGEAAVNLNALLPNFGQCYAIASVFVRTKSSASANAELKDFIKPFQLNHCIDETPPQVTCPVDVTLSCGQSTDPEDLGFAHGTDNCDQDPAVTYTDSVVTGNCINEFTILRKWEVSDQCGNSTVCMQTITLVDNAAPEIVGKPGPLSVQCPGDVPAPDVSSIHAVDECGNVTVTHVSDVPDGQSCPGHITRTYRVGDGCGNAVDVVQVITIDDTTPPTIAAPRGVTVQCVNEVPPADTRLVTASDNCGSVRVIHVGDVSNDLTCPGVITRTYRAVDGCGNATDATQLITVDDTTPPQVAGPGDIAVSCQGDIPPADTGLISTTDNCGGVSVRHVGDVSDGKSCPEVVHRTYRVTDACGRHTDWVQNITVDDETPPVVAGPGNIEVECGSALPPANTGLITATDNCGAVTVTHVGDVSDGRTCPETIFRTYRVTDACGRHTDWVQAITISDHTIPQIACPADLNVECVNDIPRPDTGSIVATDNCGGVTVVHVGDFSDNKSCPETISRVFRATDACGHSTTCTQKIIVRDQTPPEITSGPGSLQVQCRGNIPAPSTESILARDNCGSVNIVHVGDVSDGRECPEQVTRTYRAYDECGNYRDFVQSITVDDDVPPQITSCPTRQVIECPAWIDFEDPTATDNCDPAPAIIVVSEYWELGSEPWTFTAIRRLVATDQCGNTSAECRQTITYRCEAAGLCTHTQGFYGNAGGYFNGIGTLELIQAALSNSSLVVGLDGLASLTIPYQSAHCVIERLPAGTTPATLPYRGNSTLWPATCLPMPKDIPLNSDGKFENVLLGQTITLGLNMRLNPPLFLFRLSEEFCTQDALPGPDKLLGTEDDVLDADSPIGHYSISPAVLQAISKLGLWPTVKGLYDLANRALAGASTEGATLSQINNAVDAINTGFDGCRFIVDCPAPGGKGSNTDLFAQSQGAGGPPADLSANLPDRFQLGQNHPNPFNPTTRITIAVPEAVRWELAVYNVAGQLVRRFEGSTGGAEFVTVEWDGRDARGRPMATGVYLYRVQAGTFTDVKKMVLLK